MHSDPTRFDAEHRGVKFFFVATVARVQLELVRSETLTQRIICQQPSSTEDSTRDHWHRLIFGDDAWPSFDDAALDELGTLFHDDSGRLPEL